MSAPPFSEIELSLTAAALAGDASALYGIAADLMEEGISFDALLFDYLLPTESAVGHRWAQGDYLVAEEHAATAAIETVIALLTGMMDQPRDAPLVVVATAEGDAHSLPARAAAAYLIYLGYRTTFLGPSLPAADLGEFLEVEKPLAVVLSVAMTNHLPGARSVVEAAHAAGVPVLAGGKGLGSSGQWLQVIGADSWGASMRQVPEILEQWAAGGLPALAQPVEESSKALELSTARTAVLAVAETRLSASAAVSPRLREELALLVSAVEAGLLAGDPSVMTEMLVWQHQTLAAHGHDASALADAVQASLTELAPTVGAFFDEARRGLDGAV